MKNLLYDSLNHLSLDLSLFSVLRHQDFSGEDVRPLQKGLRQVSIKVGIRFRITRRGEYKTLLLETSPSLPFPTGGRVVDKNIFDVVSVV